MSDQARSNVINVGETIDHSRLNRASIKVILLCGLIMLMDGYDFGIMSVAAPSIMKEWDLSTAAFGGVFSAVFVGYLFGALLFGALSDSIGRKKTLILGAWIFSIGTLLVYFSNSLATLIPLRVFAGIGIGGAVPCAITLTSEYSPAKGRGKYVSVMYSGFLIGNVLAKYLAGYMLAQESIGWRPLFLVGFFAPVAAIIILAYKLPESARWLAARYKTVAQKEALVRIMKEVRPDSDITPETEFISGESRKEKVSMEALFRGKLSWVTPTVWAYYLVSSIAVFSFSNWGPQLLVMKGFTASTAAYIVGSNDILITIGCLLSGFYFDRFGFRSGALLHLIAAAGVSFMGGLAPLGFVILLFATGFFINFAHMDVTILAPIVYPPACRNRGAGTAIAVGRIGAILGPSILGILLATQWPLGRLLALVSIPLVLAAVFCYLAGRAYDFYLAPLYAGKIREKEK